jgi:flavodoxin I
MNCLVVYDSVYGNTEQVARAIATALTPSHSVCLTKADEIASLDAASIDLLFVGGPTQRHGMSPPITAVLKATPRGTLNGVKVAAFDTRYRMAAWLTGSAASGIARQLRNLGGALQISPESFFIERDQPPEGEKRRHNLEQLEEGEIERAGKWAVEIVRSMGLVKYDE